MADVPAPDPLSLADLTQALTALTRVLAATVEDQRHLRRLLQRMVITQTVLILVALLLLFFLTWQIRALQVQTAALAHTLAEQAQVLAAQTRLLAEHLPPR